MAYIDADKLIEFANNHKDKMIDANDIARFPRADVVPKSEVEKWVDRCRDFHEIGELKCKEIGRLHGILLQFTDIVHKWGAKNNVDTSEISLVPILQEEADSIIEKAKQEVAREIFEEIEGLITNQCLMLKDERGVEGYVKASVHYALAELKKKYTESEGNV